MIDNSYLGNSDEVSLCTALVIYIDIPKKKIRNQPINLLCLICGSLQVTKVMDKVEAAFIKYFSNSHRKEGLRILRPTAKRQRHRVTAFLGTNN